MQVTVKLEHAQNPIVTIINETIKLAMILNGVASPLSRATNELVSCAP